MTLKDKIRRIFVLLENKKRRLTIKWSLLTFNLFINLIHNPYYCKYEMLYFDILFIKLHSELHTLALGECLALRKNNSFGHRWHIL